jgi:hypothetical protein
MYKVLAKTICPEVSIPSKEMSDARCGALVQRFEEPDPKRCVSVFTISDPSQG